MTEPPLTKEQQIEAAWNQHNFQSVEKIIYTAEFLQDLFVKQEGLCGYCRGEMVLPSRNATHAEKNLSFIVATREHVVPKDLGGGDDPSNVIAACRECNTVKCNIDPATWFGWIAECPVKEDPAYLRSYLKLEAIDYRKSLLPKEE